MNTSLIHQVQVGERIDHALVAAEIGSIADDTPRVRIANTTADRDRMRPVQPLVFERAYTDPHREKMWRRIE